MNEQKREHFLHEAFEISVLIKFLSGFWELAAGSLILSRLWPHVAEFFVDLAQGAPIFLRGDLVMRYLIHFFGDMSVSTRHFIGAYLLIYGVIKIGTSYGLLRGYRWSYPLGMFIIGLFVVYQVYRDFHTHSVFLAFMIAVDLITLGLIVHEYFERWRHHWAKVNEGM